MAVDDGRGVLFIADRMNSRLSAFTRGGQFIAATGRAGSGPGEFRHAGAVASGGSNVYVLDRRNLRISTYVLRGDSFSLTAETRLPFDVADMCLLNGQVFLLGYQQGRMIHQFDLGSGRVIASFGRPFREGDPVMAALTADEPDGVVVRESAGVRIVESPAALADRPVSWSLSEAPEVSIGVVEGDPSYQLFAVNGAAVLPDGGIVVANGGTQELRFFDREGRFARSVGRRGGGPGEFQFPGLLPAAAYDSLLIADFLVNRFTFIGSDGAVGRIVTPAGVPADSIGWLPDGRLLMQRSGATAAPDTPEGILTNEITYVIADLDGGATQTLVQFPGARLFLSQSGGQIAFTQVPFEGSPSAAVGPDGFYLTPGTLPEVYVYAGGGALRRVLRVQRPLQLVERSEFDAYVQAQVEGASNPLTAVELRRRYARMPLPERRPAYQSLQVDAAGHVWAEHFRAQAGDTPRWTIFNADGSARGTMDTPPGLRIYQVGTEFVLGQMRDEFDVEYVVRYRLTRS
ncbi:hypothetical protein BH23GEM3_BH23GEM3_15150 [soil metagenome]